MAAVIVPINRLGDYRKAMAGLRTKGSLAFHMSQEKSAKKKVSLETLLEIPGIGFLFAKSALRDRSLARESVLISIIQSLNAQDEWNLVLDRTTEQVNDFRAVLQIRKRLGLNIQVVHSSRYEDTGLWGCDILAWSIDSKLMKDLIRLGSVTETSTT